MLTRIITAALFALLLGVPAARAQVTIANGGLWQIDVHANLKACLSGHCTSSSARNSVTFPLPSGSIVNVGVLVGGCASVVDPAELAALSSYVPRKRGGLKLKVASVRQLNGLLRGCTGYPGFHLTYIKGNLVLAPDGNSFDTAITAGFTLVAQGHKLGATLVVKVHGARIGDEGAIGFDMAPSTVDLIAPAIRQLGLPSE
jgi:hypothetical protein